MLGPAELSFVEQTCQNKPASNPLPPWILLNFDHFLALALSIKFMNMFMNIMALILGGIITDELK